MPVRIYSLAKDLKVDSKELVDLCKKARITGKGSALASLTDEEAQRMTDRAVRIVKATEAGDLLPRPFKDRSFFECKFCAFAERCWGLPA